MIGNPHLGTVELYFDRIGAADFGTFFELWSDDGVFEMPFPVENPVIARGKPAIEAFYRQARKGMATARIKVDEVMPAADPTYLIAVGHGEATTSDGRPYNNRYIWIFEFAPGGRVKRLREWADPLVIQSAFSRPNAPTAEGDPA